VNIKPLLRTRDDDDYQSAQRDAQDIALLLQTDLPEYPGISEFIAAQSVDEVNNALTRLYDWADSHWVWLGLKMLEG
jgi:hypothetical protein